MQRYKYKGLVDRFRKSYTIYGEAEIDVSELYEGYLLSRVILFLESKGDTKIEVINQTVDGKVLNVETYNIYEGESGYLVLESPLTRLKVSGKVKITFIGLQR